MFVQLRCRYTIHQLTFVKWSEYLWRNSFLGASISVDGIELCIESSSFSSPWYSHIFNGPGLRYEIGILLTYATVVWEYGSFKCEVLVKVKKIHLKLEKVVSRSEWVVSDRIYTELRHWPWIKGGRLHKSETVNFVRGIKRLLRIWNWFTHFRFRFDMPLGSIIYVLFFVIWWNVLKEALGLSLVRFSWYKRSYTVLLLSEAYTITKGNL